MSNKLYHISTGIPFKLALPAQLELSYSRHAMHAATTDRYGAIRLPGVIRTAGFRVIEVEVDANNKPVKILIRGYHNGQLDICYAILTNQLGDGSFLVKTVWLNERTDTHITLDKSKYYKAS